MREFLSEHWKYGMGAIALHLIFAGFIVVAVTFTANQVITVPRVIEVEMPDPNAALRAREAARKQKEKHDAAAAQRAADERRKQEAEAEEQRKAEAAQKQAEQERQAEAQRKQEQAEKERQAQEKQAQVERQRKEQQAAAEKQRVAEIQRKQKEAADRKQAAEDAKARAARESELKNALAQEESTNEARSSSLMAQYISLLTQHVERHWTKPLSWRPGIACTVKLTQTPSGTVLDAQIGQCDGDAAVRNSIQTAVLRSSPLPPPPDMRVFDRNLTFVFKPTE